MKKFTFSILTFVLFMITLLFPSCDGGDPKEVTPDVQALLTSGTWEMHSVVIDGVNKNDMFTNFGLSFTGSGFTSSNGEPVWPASGTWVFVGTDQKSIMRSDGVKVTIEDISESEMTLKLHWDKSTLGGGRIRSTEGNYTFVLNQ